MLDGSIRRYLEQSIFPDLKKGRTNWDLPHTKSVVSWVEKIITQSYPKYPEPQVLIISAYAHDWGYSQIFSHPNPSLDQILAVKKQHAIYSAQKVRILLKDDIFTFLNSSQKRRICHLVTIHDNLSKLTELDELILMEADTLGSLETHQHFSTFDDKSTNRWLSGVIKSRLPRFITPFSRAHAHKLLSYFKKTT